MLSVNLNVVTFVTFKVHISTASSSIAPAFHKHININAGNALLVTMHENATEMSSRFYLFIYFSQFGQR
jgi:hypothetical protein